MIIEADEKYNKIYNMVSDLIGKRLVFFIGAGFSRGLGYPGWGELLKTIINENDLLPLLKQSSLFSFESEENETTKLLNEKILNNLLGVDFLRLAGYVNILLEKDSEKRSIKGEIRRIIKKFEDDKINNEEDYKEYKQFFSKVRPYINEIITTNYDTNIEYCLEDVNVINRNLNSIIHKKSETSLFEIKLHKIHGCIEDLNEDLIITEKDFQDFTSSNKYIFYKLYSIFMENTIVFIGYSLNDPNIRSLLSEVVDQIKANNLETKKIYWINREKINDIDKIYYENVFSAQIVDEVEIIEFFNLTVRALNAKLEYISKIHYDLNDLADDILRNVHNDIEFWHLIDKVNADRDEEEVISLLHHKYFIESDSRKYLVVDPIFKIASKSTDVSQKIISVIKEVIEDEDRHLINIVKLCKDENIKIFLDSQGFTKKILKHLIKYSNNVNSFAMYEICANSLLDFYNINEGNLYDFEEDFISSFVRNYKYLTSGKILRYSFESMGEIKTKFNKLTEPIVIKILESYNSYSKNEVEIEQIQTLLKFSSIDKPKKYYLAYTYVYKPTYKELIYRTIRKVLYKKLVKESGYEYEYEFEIEEDHFVKGDNIIRFITSEIDETDIFEIKYAGQNLVIELYFNYERGKIIFTLNGKEIENPAKDSVKENIVSFINEVQFN